MKKAKNTWSLKNGINDVEKDLLHLFSTDGFKVDSSSNNTGDVKISAINKVKLPRLFFQLKRPEIIKCALYSEGSCSTRVELSYKYSKAFICFTNLALTIAASIMFGLPYIVTRYSETDLAFSICIPIVFIGYCAFMYVLFRIMVSDHSKILFKSLKVKGHAPVVVKRASATRYTWNYALFAFVLLALLCSPMAIEEPQSAVFFCTVIVVGLGAVLCSQASPNKITRAPHFIVLFSFATAFALYGILPILALAPPITTSSLIQLCVYIIKFFGILFIRKKLCIFRSCRTYYKWNCVSTVSHNKSTTT